MYNSTDVLQESYDIWELNDVQAHGEIAANQRTTFSRNPRVRRVVVPVSAPSKTGIAAGVL